MTGTAAPYRVQSVYDALKILEHLVATDGSLTSSQIAASCGTTRNRTFRLVKTLEECGYVTVEPGTSSYRPTLKLLSLGQDISRQRTMQAIADPLMKRLSRDVGETVYLAARDGDETVCLLTVESTQPLRIAAQAGRRWPLGRGAAGQALLLSTSPEEQDRILDRHPEFRQDWHDVLDRFERDGTTYVDGREQRISDADVIALGVPIHDSHGVANHALCVVWPITRAIPDLVRMRQALLETAHDLEVELGVSGGDHSISSTSR